MSLLNLNLNLIFFFFFFVAVVASYFTIIVRGVNNDVELVDFAGEIVTCSFTADNKILEMRLNDLDVTSKIVGNLQDWTSVKSLSFTPQPIPVRTTFAFKIEEEDSHALPSTTGFIMGCKSNAKTSNWNLPFGIDANCQGIRSLTSLNSISPILTNGIYSAFPSDWYVFNSTNIEHQSCALSTSTFFCPVQSCGAASSKIWMSPGNNGTAYRFGVIKFQRQGVSSCSPRAGAYCDGVIEFECPLGYFCPAGSRSPTICPPGSFCPKLGLSEPIRCTLKSYCPGFGRLAPIPCPGGAFCFSSGISAPIPCPNGHFCNRNNDGASLCQLKGSYCPSSLESISEELCPVGHFCPNPTKIENCPIGSYCDVAGLVAPRPCRIGHFCPSPGLLQPIPCKPGSFCPSNSVNETLCPEGFYCPTPSIKVPCPSGFFCISGSQEPSEKSASPTQQPSTNSPTKSPKNKKKRRKF